MSLTNLIPAAAIARQIAKFSGPVVSQIVNAVGSLRQLPPDKVLAAAQRMAAVAASAAATERAIKEVLDRTAPRRDS
jgi:hypothetical protein